MRARLRDSVSGRYRAAENFLLTKHVVAAGRFAKDAGSTPAASSLRSSAGRTKTATPTRRAEVRRKREPAFEAKAGHCQIAAALELRLGKPVKSNEMVLRLILQSKPVQSNEILL